MFSGYCSGGKMRAFVLNEYKSKKGTKKQISWAVFFRLTKVKTKTLVFILRHGTEGWFYRLIQVTCHPWNVYKVKPINVRLIFRKQFKERLTLPQKFQIAYEVSNFS